MESREHLWAEAMRAERRGDAAAYECLLREIADLLRRLIRYRVAQLGLSAHETEDLVQEVLIGLHTKRHTWDEDRPFLPWLHAIARYKIADNARHRRREARHCIDLTFNELAELVEAPAEDLDRSLLDIDRHLSDLPQGPRPRHRGRLGPVDGRKAADERRRRAGHVSPRVAAAHGAGRARTHEAKGKF
jgi:RNA polymerase sigma-70 factor, ECF subfamily